MSILNIIGGIIAIIVLLFVTIIISTPVPRHNSIRCPIGKNPLRSLDKEDNEK